MFYGINSTRFSLREYWWGSRSPLVIFSWLTKWFKVRLPSSTDDPNVDYVGPFEVPETSVPEDIRARFQKLLSELQGLGFGAPIWHAIEDPLIFTRIYWASSRHSSGQVIARAHLRIWTQPHPPREYLFPVFISAFDDGTFLTSSAGKPDTLSPPVCRAEYSTGKDPATLWNSHVKQLEKETLRKAVTVLHTDDELRATTEQLHAAIRDFHLARGAFQPLTAEEEEQAGINRSLQETAAASGFAHPEVLAEMNRIQSQKSSGRSTLILLVVSILFFLLLGKSGNSWTYIFILIPVIFFHELGHYLAMLLFGYRNLKMFFIPGFGAAVMGRHYNVPGWKKTMVSLMGPLPGIVLAIPIGITGLVMHNPTIIQVAEILLVINGFNLLPILPFDGGWVVHATLFCRHPIFDAIFRVVAAVGLLILGIALQARFLPYLAIPMLIAIPMAYRSAKIAMNLREQGYSTTSPDDQTIPPATAQTIISEVKTAFPKQQNNKTIAQLTLNIFELMNARPPSWPATIGLLSMHVTGFFFAVVFGIVFVIGQKSSLLGFMDAAARSAQHYPMACEARKKAPGKNADQTTPKNHIIVSLKNPAEAVQQFTQLSPRVPEDATLALFGQTLILSLPNTDDPARQKWFNEFQKFDKKAFVATTNSAPTFAVTCIAPTEEIARSIQDDLDEYFTGGFMYLIPPWASPDPRSPEEQRQHQRARRPYKAVQNAVSGSHTNVASTGIFKQINEARRQGDAEKAKRLATEQKLQQKEAQMEAIEIIRAQGAYDSQVVERYKQELLENANFEQASGNGRNGYTNYLAQLKKRQMETGKLLGQLPMTNDVPQGPIASQAATHGYAHREGLLIQIQWISFDNPIEGPDRLVAWLCGKNCKSFKYMIFGGGFGGLDDPGDPDE